MKSRKLFRSNERFVLRLIDANFNRVREGLRVCEDIFRFLYDDSVMTLAFKKLRHDCSKTLLAFPILYHDLVDARDSNRDVGKKRVISDKPKMGWKDLILSNLKRSEEGFRVLEEASKIIAPKESEQFQLLRFKLYELEKKALKRI